MDSCQKGRSSSTSSAVSMDTQNWLPLTSQTHGQRSDSVSSTSSGPFLSNANNTSPKSADEIRTNALKAVITSEDEKRLFLLRARNH